MFKSIGIVGSIPAKASDKIRKVEYKLCKDVATDVDYIRASASLPLLSRIVETKEGRYLDGGICDSIPLKQSLKMGNQKNIVVLTRIQGYVKQPNSVSP